MIKKINQGTRKDRNGCGCVTPNMQLLGPLSGHSPFIERTCFKRYKGLDEFEKILGAEYEKEMDIRGR